MSTPTPGPYPLKITQVDDLFVIVTNQGNLFANTFDPAAARLIAAAPELLAALDGLGEAGKTVIAQLEDTTYEEGGQLLAAYISGRVVRQEDFQRLASFVEIARAALAKAKEVSRA